MFESAFQDRTQRPEPLVLVSSISEPGIGKSWFPSVGIYPPPVESQERRLFTPTSVAIRALGHGLLGGALLMSPQPDITQTTFRQIAHTESSLDVGVGSSLGYFEVDLRGNVEFGAAEFARRQGLYGALVLTQNRVRQVIPSITSLAIVLKSDPDDIEFKSICFEIGTAAPWDRISAADDRLQNDLFDIVPAAHRLHLCFSYRF
jgi:hypothetical protein